MGMVGFYARFIPDFSRRADPLHALKKGATFRWDECQSAFDTLKQALCEAPVLQSPDFAKDFVLVTDASDVAVSADLHQRADGQLAVSHAEGRYSTYEECLAVFFRCDKCRVYLLHKEFEIHCNNLALC